MIEDDSESSHKQMFFAIEMADELNALRIFGFCVFVGLRHRAGFNCGERTGAAMTKCQKGVGLRTKTFGREVSSQLSTT